MPFKCKASFLLIMYNMRSIILAFISIWLQLESILTSDYCYDAKYFNPDFPRRGSFGAACSLKCEKHGSTSRCATAKDCISGNGWDGDYCSEKEGYSYTGKRCRHDHECGLHGKKYYWCNIEMGPGEGSSSEFCSPAVESKSTLKTYTVGNCKYCSDPLSAEQQEDDALVPILLIKNTFLYTGIFYSIKSLRYEDRFLEVAESLFISCGFNKTGLENATRDMQWMISPTERDGEYVLTNRGAAKRVAGIELVARGGKKNKMYNNYHVLMDPDEKGKDVLHRWRFEKISNTPIITEHINNAFTYQILNSGSYSAAACLYDHINNADRKLDYEYLQVFAAGQKSGDKDKTFVFMSHGYDLSGKITEFVEDFDIARLPKDRQRVKFFGHDIINNSVVSFDTESEVGYHEKASDLFSYSFVQSLKAFDDITFGTGVKSDRLGFKACGKASQFCAIKESKVFGKNWKIKVPKCTSLRIDYYLNLIDNYESPFVAKMIVTAKGARMTVKNVVCDCRHHISGSLVYELLKIKKFAGKIIKVNEHSVEVEITGTTKRTYNFGVTSTTTPIEIPEKILKECKEKVNQQFRGNADYDYDYENNMQY